MSGNDQVFPSLAAFRVDGHGYDTPIPVQGLTKRELFAAMAMQGLSANPDPQVSSWGGQQTAQCAVAFADALLAELEKPHA